MEILKLIMYIFEQRVHIHDRMMRHHKSIKNLHNSYWNGNAILLWNFRHWLQWKLSKWQFSVHSINDDNFIKMTFPIWVSYYIMHLHHSIIVLYNAIIDKNNTDIYDSMIYAGVGVTKPISSVPLFSEFFSITKTHVSYWISRLYLTGVAAAQLRWHLSNINVIRII